MDSRTRSGWPKVGEWIIECETGAELLERARSVGRAGESRRQGVMRMKLGEPVLLAVA